MTLASSKTVNDVMYRLFFQATLWTIGELIGEILELPRCPKTVPFLPLRSEERELLVCHLFLMIGPGSIGSRIIL
jgi:hypothetical protein